MRGRKPSQNLTVGIMKMTGKIAEKLYTACMRLNVDSALYSWIILTSRPEGRRCIYFLFTETKGNRKDSDGSTGGSGLVENKHRGPTKLNRIVGCCVGKYRKNIQ